MPLRIRVRINLPSLTPRDHPKVVLSLPLIYYKALGGKGTTNLLTELDTVL